MKAIEWNDAVMSVGHPLVDEQHRKLIDLLNLMGATLQTSAGDARLVSQVLKELCDYTVTHFDSEESLMDPLAYPEYDAHICEHIECTQAVLDFLHAYSEKSEGDLKAFAAFATDWVVRHVLGTDKILGRFLASRAA